MTKGELQSVRDELTGAVAPAEAPDASALEAEIAELRSEIASLRGEGEGGAAKSGAKPKPRRARRCAAEPSDSQQLKEAGEEAIERSEGKESK